MSMRMFILKGIAIVIAMGIFGLVVCHFYTKWSDRRMGINRKKEE